MREAPPMRLDSYPRRGAPTPAWCGVLPDGGSVTTDSITPELRERITINRQAAIERKRQHAAGRGTDRPETGPTGAGSGKQDRARGTAPSSAPAQESATRSAETPRPETGPAGAGSKARDMNRRPAPSPTSFLDVVALPDLGNTCFISCVLQLIVRMPKLLRRCQGLSSNKEAQDFGGHILDMYQAMANTQEPAAAWGAFQHIVRMARARGWQPTTGSRLSVTAPQKYGPGDPQRFLLNLLGVLDAGVTSGGISDLFSISIATRYSCRQCSSVSFAPSGHQIATPFLPLPNGTRDRHLQTILDQYSDPAAKTERIWCSECGTRQAQLSRRVVTAPPHYLCVRLRQDLQPLRHLTAPIWFPRALDKCRCDFSQMSQACICGARRRYVAVGSLGAEAGELGKGATHFVARVPDVDGQWHLVDHRVRSSSDLQPNPYILLLRHQPDEDVIHKIHDEQVGAELPCVDCMVPGCGNHVRTEAVEVRRSEWLADQRGLYTKLAVRAGTFVATFAVRNVRGEDGRAAYYIRATAAGGGPVQYLRPADIMSAGSSKVAAFANHSCCHLCINCSIVHSGCSEQPVAWIRALRDIPAGAEVLVDYGSSYGLARCQCAQCSPHRGGAPHQHIR